VLRVDEKHLREHYIANGVGVILTGNYKTDGIYLPHDDRRTYVAWSDREPKDFAPAYWNGLWRWYREGGLRHVAAYLAELDISGFDPKAPPRKTPAFWAIVDANRAPEDAELADVIEKIEEADRERGLTNAALTLSTIVTWADAELGTWLRDRKNRRAIPHRMEKCGYVPVRNEDAADGLWRFDDKRQVIYAKSALSIRDRFTAAKTLAENR